MTNWKEYILGELIQTVSKTFKFSDMRVIFLNTSDTLKGKVINHNYFEPKKLPGQAKKSIQKNDILYSEIRPTNRRYAFVDFESSNYVVSTKLMVLRVLDKEIICSKYLYYFITSNDIVNYLQMLAESRSGTFPQIRFEEISLLNIKLPPLNVQNQIVELISSLDDKIELNNQINENLEILAQSLFKQWFVDFEFPDKKENPYKSSGGKMIESELGEIPKGWKVYSMDELLETVSKTYPLKKVKEVVFLNTGDIQDGKFLHKNFSNPENLPGQAKKSIAQNDILYSEIRPANKRFAYVYFDASQYVVSTKLMVMRSKVEINSLFQYFYLTQQESIKYLQHLAESRSGTFPQITFSEVSTIKIALPDFELVNTFVEIALKPYYDNQFQVKDENEKLILLRDLLLPKLISGELEVKAVKDQLTKA